MIRLPFIAALLGLFGFSQLVQPARSQSSDFVPLSVILASDHETSYPFIRCAAFWTANVEWAGQAIDQATYDRAAQSVQSLLLVAVLVRTKTANGDISYLTDIAMRDVRTTADLYLANYQESYGLRGAAWDGNKLWTQDNETCEPIALAASQVSESVREER